MAEPMLKVTDVRAAYGKIEALKGVSLEVMEGERRPIAPVGHLHRAGIRIGRAGPCVR